MTFRKRLRLYIVVVLLLSPSWMAHGLEFDIQEITVVRDQKVAYVPYVTASSDFSELLVIKTPDLDEREKQVLGLYEEPVRAVSIYRRSGSSWEMRLQKDLDASMDLIDTMHGEDGIGLVGYRAETPYFLDENQDGLDDLAFWINGRFQIFLQDPNGTFMSDALIMDPDKKDVLGGYFSVSLSEDAEDQGDSQRMLDGVEDIDGDGLADLIIQRMEGEGIFGLETQYEIYRGALGPDKRLTFEQSASSTVSSGGIQLNNERQDLTGDGQQDLLVQKGLDTLLVYPGVQDRKWFAKSPLKLELELPKDRQGFVVSDLNHDGRDELILHVDRETESVLSVVEFSD